MSPVCVPICATWPSELADTDASPDLSKNPEIAVT